MAPKRQVAEDTPSFWGAMASLTEMGSGPAVSSALDNVALSLGDVIDAATQDGSRRPGFDITEMASDFKSFVASAVGLEDESGDEAEAERQKAAAMKKSIASVSPRSRQEASSAISDFCQKYPAARVRPNSQELDKLWAKIHELKPIALTSAFYDELSFTNGHLAAKKKTALLQNIKILKGFGQTLRILTPDELQVAVARAIRPDGRESRLYGALLAVAMGWWHEVHGDEKLFANALGRAAISARRELGALDSSVRPAPLRRIRQLWDEGCEDSLKASGVVVMDLDPMPGLWEKLAEICRESFGRRYLASAGALVAARARKAQKLGLRATSSTILIDEATSGDLLPAADVAVRALRWTEGWLDTPNFSDEDYALLSGREAPTYQSLYLADNGYPSTLLVARLQEKEEKKESSWFDFGSGLSPQDSCHRTWRGGSSSKVVGCVGCEVKCFNRLTNEMLPATQYDGGKQTVLRPVMADLAVSSECRGRGVGRKLVEKLEDVVRKWGYDELVLLVEATNFQARGVYERLNYRLAGLRPAEATFFLDKSDGGRRVAERKTVALLLRKSLKPFPQGDLENLNWGAVLTLLGLGLALTQTPEVVTLLQSNAKLGERSEVVVTGCDKEDQPLGTIWALCSALAAEVLRCFRLMELQVLTELRLLRPGSTMEVDNGGLLPDNRREVSFRFFVPVDGRPPGPDATLALHTKDRELALSHTIQAGRAFAWWSRQTFHQLLGGIGRSNGFVMATSRFAAGPWCSKSLTRVEQPRPELQVQSDVAMYIELTVNSRKRRGMPSPACKSATAEGDSATWNMGNSQLLGSKCCLGAGGYEGDMPGGMSFLRSSEVNFEAQAVGSHTSCLCWRTLGPITGVPQLLHPFPSANRTEFSIELEQLQDLHAQINTHLTVFRAVLLFDDATSGLIMGNGVEDAGMNAPDSMTRLGQLLCRWALSQSPAIGILVGVDHGVLYSVQGLLSFPSGNESPAYFGPVSAGARHLADTSRQEGMVHISTSAKEQLSALRLWRESIDAHGRKLERHVQSCENPIVVRVKNFRIGARDAGHGPALNAAFKELARAVDSLLDLCCGSGVQGSVALRYCASNASFVARGVVDMQHQQLFQKADQFKAQLKKDLGINVEYDGKPNGPASYSWQLPVDPGERARLKAAVEAKFAVEEVLGHAVVIGGKTLKVHLSDVTLAAWDDLHKKLQAHGHVHVLAGEALQEQRKRDEVTRASSPEILAPGTADPKPREVLVANCQMDTDKIKIYGARVKVDSLEAVAEIEQAEKDKMKKKIEKIVDHKCNVFINRQLIYNYPDQLLKEAGVMAIEHSDFDGSERLAAVLGADIASTFDNPELTVLGSCKRIEEIMIGEDKVIKFSGCSKGEACTIVLRGSSQHVLDEAERSLHDALAVLYQTVQETRVVWGGGSMEMAMAQAVQQKLTEVGGKESVAMESFGKALMQIPVILADNAGLDSAELVGQLRAAHAKGQNSFGLEFNNGTIADMSQLGIMESFRSKMSQLCSAAEAAEMIIRVDDIIKNAPRQRDG
eukprot:s3378_g4.t1